MTNDASDLILQKIQEMRDESAERHRLVQEQLTITSVAIDDLAQNVLTLRNHVKSHRADINPIAIPIDHRSRCLDRVDDRSGPDKPPVPTEATQTTRAQLIAALPENASIRVSPECFDAFIAALAKPATLIPEMVKLFQRKAPWESQ